MTGMKTGILLLVFQIIIFEHFSNEKTWFLSTWIKSDADYKVKGEAEAIKTDANDDPLFHPKTYNLILSIYRNLF